MKLAVFACVNHARIRSWNQPVLNNESKLFLAHVNNGSL